MNATDRTEDVVTSIAELRDQHIADARTATTAEKVEISVAHAAAFRHALSLLHIASGGAYGVKLVDQPNPYEVPIFGDRSGASGVTP
jgi:hypothetical protein